MKKEEIKQKIIERIDFEISIEKISLHGGPERTNEAIMALEKIKRYINCSFN